MFMLAVLLPAIPVDGMVVEMELQTEPEAVVLPISVAVVPDWLTVLLPPVAVAVADGTAVPV